MMEHARGEESRPQKVYSSLRAALLAFDENSTHVFSALFFAAMAAQSSPFTPAQVFTSLILVDRIKNRIFALTRFGAFIIDGILSLQNIDSYLRDTRTDIQRAATVEIQSCNENTAVAITRACFTENSSSANFKVLLDNVNLTI